MKIHRWGIHAICICEKNWIMTRLQIVMLRDYSNISYYHIKLHGIFRIRLQTYPMNFTCLLLISKKLFWFESVRYIIMKISYRSHFRYKCYYTPYRSPYILVKIANSPLLYQVNCWMNSSSFRGMQFCNEWPWDSKFGTSRSLRSAAVDLGSQSEFLFISHPIRKNRGAAHFAARGLHVGNGVGCPWAAHGNFAMQIRLPTTSIYGNSGQLSGQPTTSICEKSRQLSGQLSGLPMGCPWEFCHANKAAHYFHIRIKWAAQCATQWAAHYFQVWI